MGFNWIGLGKMAKSTPATIAQPLKAKGKVKRIETMKPPMGPVSSGSNAQREAYERAMNSAHRNTKVHGVPGGE